jgi:AcrR family transcriptional regulator
MALTTWTHHWSSLAHREAQHMQAESSIGHMARLRAEIMGILVDRRTQRTRAALRDALLSLLPELGWDEIDVAMLCERANIGRSTFYLHYTDKAAFLRSAFADLQAAVQASIKPDEVHRPYAFLPALLDHVHENQAIFRSLLGRRSGQVVQDHMRDMLIALFSSSGTAHGSAQSATATSAQAHMLAGCLMQLMVWWLGSAWQFSADDIEARFLCFAVVPRGSHQGQAVQPLVAHVQTDGPDQQA